ncbi:tRNA methyltransferase [Jimgerdemannia flammicorona]|uniref:tRNA methyltransferase n=2 Tax=Jimgerdemannia flammicorona TaxID=994334 RepID=A0A433B8R1_9FUNG|nr:tRNA methyltransferase [Jimgerdemannia flammicorona]RUS24516.1 tRNA methyltransferase [Jimgerdemannia flammicorona]
MFRSATTFLSARAMAAQIDLTLFNTVTEGRATILFPKNNEVFYNPVQQFNRDMSIAAIRTWSELYLKEKRDKVEKKKRNKTHVQGESAIEPAEILDSSQAEKDYQPTHVDATTESHAVNVTVKALSASGLRSIRYAKEIPNVRYIMANDLEQDAVDSIKRNVAYNGLSEDLVRPNKGDAMAVMYSHREEGKRFDVVDLDPYGTASPFIDGAVQALSDGGK